MIKVRIRVGLELGFRGQREGQIQHQGFKARVSRSGSWLRVKGLESRV